MSKMTVAMDVHVVNKKTSLKDLLAFNPTTIPGSPLQGRRREWRKRPRPVYPQRLAVPAKLGYQLDVDWTDAGCQRHRRRRVPQQEGALDREYAYKNFIQHQINKHKRALILLIQTLALYK